jgi:hypothetical protein
MDPNTLIDQLINRSEFSENITYTRELLQDLQDGFANKYVLYFGDDYNDFGYRVLIQQRGYAGSVLPMIGTNDPVTLEWESDNDFYNPIKGSRCNINLMVTDAVGYDNFYAEPEQSYKVLLQWFGYDAPPPASGPQTWNTFWTGYLVADTFKEAVLTKPYAISLTAIDGLGTIDSYILDPIIYNPQFTTESAYPLQIKIISNILRNLNLGLEIWANHEWITYRELIFGSTHAAFDCFLDGGNQLSTKDILTAILNSTNSRIFQSNNKWCIIPNSCYEPEAFTTQIQSNAVALGYQPTNILAQKTAYIIANGTEIANFETFDSFGNYLGGILNDAHLSLPGDTQNIGSDLMVEYLPPYQTVEINYDVSQFNRRKYEVNPNQFFHYHNQGYTIENGVIGRYDYTINDSPYSYRNLQYVTNENFNIPAITTQMVPTSENIFFSRKSSCELSIQYLYDSDLVTTADFNYQFEYSIKITYGFTTFITKYYNADDSTWSGLSQYIVSEVTNTNKLKNWVTTSTQFILPDDIGQYANITLEVIIYRPYLSTAVGYNANYIGEISLQSVDESQLTNHTFSLRQSNNTNVFSEDRVSIDHITGFSTFPEDNVINGIEARRPRDYYTGWEPTTRSEIINQEILNDFRKNLQRYEGTLKNNHYRPLNMLNRVWINFGASVLQLPDSCYIDSMAVNLKRNEYKVNMHLPNIDTDQVATKNNRFTK